MLIATGLAIAVLASRLPFAARMLFEWDSALYAQALEHGFHVDTEIADERPHPPGYLFYLAVARGVRLMTADSNAALVAVAVLASAALAAAVYLVGRRWMSRPLSAATAIGLAASPLVWRYSEVAMPYTLLALLSIVLAWLFLAVRERRASAIAVTFAFGALAGFRQDVLLLLAPLWLWAIATTSWRERGLAVVAGAIGVLAWLIPSALLSDGIGPYLGAVAGQTSHVNASFSAFGQGEAGLAQNLVFTAYALAWGVAAFALAFVAGAARLVATRGRAHDAVFFVLWIVPALVVYVFLHIGEPAYVLSILPAMFIVAARALDAVLGRAALVATVLLAIANASLFLAPGLPFTAATIAAHDRSLTRAVAATRDAFGADDTVLVAQFDYTLARYYLPEYRTLFVGDEPATLSRSPRAVALDPRASRVVAFGPIARLPDGAQRAIIAGALENEVSVLMADAGRTLTAFDVEAR